LNYKRPDLAIFTLTVVLILLGVLMVFNASSFVSQRYYKSDYSFLVRQAIFAIFSIGVLLATSFVSFQKVRKYVVPLVFGMLVILVLVIIPGIGKKVNSARRWLSIGFFQIQPSEFAKLIILIYLSSVIAKKSEAKSFGTFRGFLPPLFILLLFSLIIFVEPDFSTSILILFVGLLLFFIGGIPLGHLVGLTLSSLPFIIVLVFSRGYMKTRIFSFLNPTLDMNDSGYHIIQSLLSFHRGGLFGGGIGKGIQKMGALPESHTDFILAAHAEEIGVVGVMIPIALLFFLVYRIFKIALLVEDEFAKLFSFGTATLIGWQALMNVAVVVGLVPTTGIPLPFISAGGSSLLMFAVMVGIVLNISKNLNQEVI